MNARSLTLITAGLVIVGMLLAAIFRQPGRSVEAQPATVSGYENQPTLGNADAAVKLILFENFLCEHCKAFEEDVFPQLESNYIETGKVEAYYVNLAWGPDTATTAGLAGECAYRQNEQAFWEYKSELYKAQTDHEGSWAASDNLVRIAREKVPALDAEALQSCIEEERYLDEVERDLVLGELVGVQGTPSVVIGNRGFQAPSYQALANEIEQQLAGQE